MRRRLNAIALVSIGLIGAGALLCAPAALAQSPSDSGGVHRIMIRPTVPGAKGMPEPAPNTSLPSWAQASYRAYLQMKKEAHGGTHYTRADYAKMPDWSGLFTHTQGFAWDPQQHNPLANAPGGPAAQAILDHCKSFPCKNWVTAALTPKYALQYRQKLTAVAHGFEWDQLSDCLPAGFPRMLIDPFYREYIDTPTETWMSAETEGEFRRIYTDGRGHIPQSEAFGLWDGDSIGFWDGNTLVVHTLYLRPEELQRNQPSISDEASVIEKVWLADPNTIKDSATIYDPKALEKPWHGVQKYARITSQDAREDMWSCASNNNVIQTAHGSSTFILPGETVLVKREYREPSNIQNRSLDKAIAYGAQLMKQEEMAKAHPKSN